MRLKHLLPAAAALAALALGPSAAANGAGEPFAFADAKHGDLRVVSFVFVGGRVAEMTGGWFNDEISCKQRRRLRVRGFVEFQPLRSDRTRVVTRRKRGLVQNCAEGGPNLGFRLRAKRLGLTCPSGRWRPGHYTFQLRTRHLAGDLEATATLFWTKTRRC